MITWSWRAGLSSTSEGSIRRGWWYTSLRVDTVLISIEMALLVCKDDMCTYCEYYQCKQTVRRWCMHIDSIPKYVVISFPSIKSISLSVCEDIFGWINWWQGKLCCFYFLLAIFTHLSRSYLCLSSSLEGPSLLSSYASLTQRIESTSFSNSSEHSKKIYLFWAPFDFSSLILVVSVSVAAASTTKPERVRAEIGQAS